MSTPHAWDGSRPQLDRTVISRRQFSTEGMSLTLATEDVRLATDWCLDGTTHTFVVHLAGRLRCMESVFSNGPSSDVLPSLGDLWVMPAGVRYAALAQGNTVRFAEFSLPTRPEGDVRVVPRIAHRDAFLHQAADRVAQLAERDDDLATTMLDSLLRCIRLHLEDLYLCDEARAPAPVPLAGGPRFSDRQRRLLVERLHETGRPARIDELAALAGVSVSSFARRFKSSFGTTPWQYLLRARLDVAGQLLQDTSFSTEHVATLAGFASASHLATSFARHRGLSPSAYRRDMRARWEEA